jgi:copper(I)-binding protein
MKPLATLVALATLTTAAQAAPVTITAPWARATLPHQTESAAYLTLTSPTADTLTAIDTQDAGMAMLHQTTRTGTTAAMSDLDSLPLPAGKPVALAPNGTHIMLMDLKHPLKPGQTLHLTLTFAHAGQQTVAIPVLPARSTGP